jgi:hypothetical protein
MIRPLEDELTTLTRAIAAGERTITATGPAPRTGDLIAVGGRDDADTAEAARVVDSRPTPTRILIEIDPALRVGHRRGEPVRLVGRPVAETSLDVPADAASTALQWSPIQLPARFVVQAGDTIIGAAASLPRVGVVGAHEVVTIAPGGTVPDDGLLQVVYDLLRRRAPVASRFRVRAAQIRVVDLDLEVVRAKSGLQRADALRSAVETALRQYLDPVTGSGGQGWPFGLPVYRAALDNVIERVPGIDHVHRLAIGGDDVSDVWPLADEAAEAGRCTARAGEVGVAILDSAQGW